MPGLIGSGFAPAPLAVPLRLLEPVENPVARIATDGGTAVLAKLDVPGPGSVRFWLTDPDEQIRDDPHRLGMLYDPWDEAPRSYGTEFDVNAIPVSDDGRYMAFCGYKAPDDFDGPDGASADIVRKPVRVIAEFTGDDGSIYYGEQDFDLARPPVVLIGDFDQPSSLWANDWPFFGPNDERFLASAHVYHENIGFDEWGESMRRGIENGLRRFRYQQRDGVRAAAAAADVVAVGHGGLMARAYVSGDSGVEYRNDVNRLVTISTPHLGSPIAEMLVRLQQEFLTQPPVNPTIGHLLTPVVELGAAKPMRDMGGHIQCEFGEAAVPSHAIAGSGNAEVITTAVENLVQIVDWMGGAIGKVARRINFLLAAAWSSFLSDPGGLLQYLEEVFDVEESDLFSPAWSQAGGLPSTAVTELDWESEDAPGILPMMVTDYRVRECVLELLNTPKESDSWASGFPASSGLDCASATASAHLQLDAVIAAIRVIDATARAGLMIAGVPVIAPPGANVGVSLAAPDDGSGAFLEASILTVGRNWGLEDSDPGQPSARVGTDTAGQVDIAGLGFMSDGSVYTGFAPPMGVSTPPVTEIEAFPNDIELSWAFPEAFIHIQGTGADELFFNLSSPLWNPLIFSSDPSVAEIGPDGVVRMGGQEGDASINWLFFNAAPANSVGVSVRVTQMQPPCLADLAPPEGVVDLADIVAFIDAFSGSSVVANLSPPFDVFDLSDIAAFVEAFNDGCPE